jgi:hypothetical protein
MSKSIKSLLYNFLAFAIFFFPFRFLIDAYTQLEGLWIPSVAFVIATLLSPKFQAINTKDGEKLYVKWLFLKGFKEIK